MPEVLVPSDCGKEKSTRHHNVPSSRGGSDDEANLSHPEGSRHADFHGWAANKTPCQLVRQLALHALGNGSKSIAPETFFTVLRATHVREWAGYYHDRAIRSVANVVDLESVILPQLHLRTQLLEELAWTRLTIEALVNGGEFPAENHLMLRKALAFFNTNSPRKAIGDLLHEKSGTEYQWTKPMDARERENMTRSLHASELFPARSGALDLAKLLRGHASNLDKYQESLRALSERYRDFVSFSATDSRRNAG